VQWHANHPIHEKASMNQLYSYTYHSMFLPMVEMDMAQEFIFEYSDL
jgi:hypothetical protein